MKWKNAVYLPRLKEFFKSQDEHIVINELVPLLKKIKGSSISRQSVTTSYRNFVNGDTTPDGEYLEAYLQFIDLLNKKSGLQAVDVLDGTFNKQVDFRDVMMRLLRGRTLPEILKEHINDQDVLEQLIDVFFKIIVISCNAQKGDPKLNLSKFRNFLEIFTEYKGDEI